MSRLQCRACGSFDIVLRGRKRGQFIPREFEFHACRACGLLFVEPFSGHAIYDDAYYRGAGADPYVDYDAEYRDWRRTDRRHEFEDLIRLAESRLYPDSGRAASGEPVSLARPIEAPAVRETPTPAGDALRWLDFGCGAGGFLKFLRERRTLGERRLEVCGHDVGSYAELLRRQDGFRILDADQIIREPDASFDVISMIEVIEHLPDPGSAIALVARLLKPAGLLLLTTGNMAGPIARRQGIHYRYCVPEIHVSLFNPQCLAQLYRRHGLEPCRVRYRGVVKFKALKSLRHRPALRACARAMLAFPPALRALDELYAVSAMPCAVKRPS